MFCVEIRGKKIYFFSHFSPLPVKGCKSYVRQSRPLRSEGSLVCHTYYHTGHPFIKVISGNTWHYNCCLKFGSEAVTTCFYDLGMWRLGFENTTFRLRGKRSNPQRHRRSQFRWNRPIGSWEDFFFNFFIVFSLLRNYLPLENGGAFHLNLNTLHWITFFVKFGWN